MGTIAQPEILTNGKTVIFDGTSTDNYYSFTINEAGNILLAVSNIYKGSSDFNIYDNELNFIGRYFGDSSTSKQLNKAGTYYIHAENPNGGSFSISSTAMGDSHMKATPLTNGKTVIFDGTSTDNYYSFTINEAGNILLAVSNIYKGSSDFNIYDNELNFIGRYFGDSSTSKQLNKAGTYYIHAENPNGGSFSVTSNQMSNIPIIITPPDEIIVEDTTHSKTLLTKTDISELYVALFGRASEKEGNIFWRDQGSIVEIADKMIASDAAKDYFGSSISSNQNFIEFIYANTLNKTVHEDPEGITYWVESLETHSRGEVVVGLINAISNYAPGSDVYNSMSIADKEKTENAYNQFKNRVEVSNYFADTLDNTPSDWKVSTSFNNNLNVTFDYNTVLKAKSLGDSLVNSVDTVIDGLYIGKYTGDQYGTINLTITETSFIGTWHNTLYGQSGKIYGSVDNVSGVLDIYSNELDGSPITFNGIVSNGYGSGTWDSIFYGNSGVFSIELI